MYTSLFRIVVAGTLMICAVAYSQTPQGQLFVPANDVTLTIRCERKTYKIGEMIKIFYTVRNVSHGSTWTNDGKAECVANAKGGVRR